MSKNSFHLFYKTFVIIQVLFNLYQRGAVHFECVPVSFGRITKRLHVILNIQQLQSASGSHQPGRWQAVRSLTRLREQHKFLESMADLCRPQRHHHLRYTGPLLQVRGEQRIKGQCSNAIKPDSEKTNVCVEQSELISSFRIPPLSICRVTVVNDSLQVLWGFTHYYHFKQAILKFTSVMLWTEWKKKKQGHKQFVTVQQVFFWWWQLKTITFAEVEFEKYSFILKIAEMKTACDKRMKGHY